MTRAADGMKTVVVTGANGGIGRATVAAFRAAGSTVIAVDLADADVVIDFAEPESVARGLAAIRAIAKSVDVLVNVAGVAEDAITHMVSMVSLRRHMRINFEAPIQMTQYLTRMMPRGGAVVNVASVTGIVGNPGQLAYGASKSALILATRAMSMDLAGRGIRVNAVAPGVIDTPMTQALNQETRDRLVGRVSMGRMGKPEEVAEAIVWLASPAASYVTGQTLRVDGGM